MATNTNAYRFIDLSYLDLMTDGDIDIKKTMLEMLFEEIPAEWSKMLQLSIDKDWTELRGVSHKMKSTLAFIGNEELTAINQKIEHNAKNMIELEDMQGLVRQMLEKEENVLAELKEEYEKL